MATITTEGIVIKSRNLAEADRIYTIFTKSKGKIKILAKGVRKITSRRSGNMDTLNRVSVSFSSKNSETSHLPILKEAQVLDSFRGIKRDLEFVKYGYGILELLERFLDESEENEKIYKLTVDMLLRLSKLKDGGRKLAKAYFEVNLLALLGYDPILSFCVECSRDFDESWEKVSFSAAAGGIYCERCLLGGVGVDASTIKLFLSLKNSNFESVQKNEVRKSALFSLDEILNYFLNYLLESPIRSVKLLTPTS